MCGICFVLLSSGDSIVDRVLDERCLKRRGPDRQHHEVIQVSESVRLLMYGCILHFRGPLTPQPLKDNHGNQLLWNGEIYEGFEVGDECDTSVLLRELAKCMDDAEILQTVAKIKGPVAFAYWQAANMKMWFGRDLFGRRSLLWHLPVDETDNLIVTSVQTAEQEFQEIPAAGIYCINLQQSESKTIALYPWENNLSVDTLPSDMQQKMSRSMYSIGIQEYSVPVNIPPLNKAVPDVSYAIPSVDSMSPLEYLDFIGKRLPEYLDYSNQLLNLLQEAINVRVFNQPRRKVKFDGLEYEVFSPINKEKNTVLDQQTVTDDREIFNEIMDGEHLKSQMACRNCGKSLNITDKLADSANKSVSGYTYDIKVPQTNVQTTRESATNCDMDENIESDEGTKSKQYEPTNVESKQQRTNVSSELYLCSVCKLCNARETLEARHGNRAKNPSPINSDSVCHNISETVFANQKQGICENKNTDLILEDPYKSKDAFANIDINSESQADKKTNPNVRPETELPARVAILFSGGIDSTVIAALADRCVPEDESIDLINVAFEQQKRETSVKENKKRNLPGPCAPEMDVFSVPDRLTGYVALQELNPRRKWNFVEVNVTVRELQKFRNDRVQKLIYPLNTVLDDSIGCAVWFAARGRGILGNGHRKGDNYASEAKVILVGMGADEQLAGYARHRVQFKEHGWLGLVNEIEMEVARISTRNLGRDDRIIADHSKEARFPFLDENVVSYLNQLPIQYKADLTLPRGLGEKLILRLCAAQLNLSATATLPKRAIQFGSRIAKCENKKEKASDVCGRLASDADR